MRDAVDQTTAILLASGRSRRFGGEKLLASYRGVPLGLHAAAVLHERPFKRRIAIVRENLSELTLLFERMAFECVINPRPEAGLGYAVALGARSAMAHDLTAILICLADMPHIDAAHIDRLIGGTGKAVSMVPGGQRTPPAWFPRETSAELLALDGSSGARQLLADARAVAASDLMLADVDTRRALFSLEASTASRSFGRPSWPTVATASVAGGSPQLEACR